MKSAVARQIIISYCIIYNDILLYFGMSILVEMLRKFRLVCLSEPSQTLADNRLGKGALVAVLVTLNEALSLFLGGRILKKLFLNKIFYRTCLDFATAY
jgi:hypothetical protein